MNSQALMRARCLAQGRGVRHRACLNRECSEFRRKDADNIKPHGFYKTQRGRLRRYRCSGCDKTFGSTKGTVYYRLHHRKKTVDAVADLSVRGLDQSSIARNQGISRTTVRGWMERCARRAQRVNEALIQDVPLIELQADELRTFIGNKRNVTWILTTLEVWSRLWMAVLNGARSYRNLLRVMTETSARGTFQGHLLVTTDGYEYYTPVIARTFGYAAVYGQVIKTRHNNRVTAVDRRLRIGTKSHLGDALLDSEDSNTLNTSFIERHNLTIRRGVAYLNRRTLSHARQPEYLDDHLSLSRCYYNFIRTHMSLKVGTQKRTPAMQAGLLSRPLSFREIFSISFALFLWRSFWKRIPVVDPAYTCFCNS